MLPRIETHSTRSDRRPSRLLVGTLTQILFAVAALTASSAVAAAESDVRIVIDVSGSMKQSDPDNLRRPALSVLTGLLPNGSQAGVWTFGQYVNMLVKHGPVNGAWKEQVRIRADSIGSVALRTNMGAALEQVSWDLDSDSRRERHIVLLTDGRVDVADDEATNAAESDRILKTILPGLVERGVKLHTLALSDAADVNFLKQLSLATGGYHGAVASADNLTDFFLKALANAAPPSEVVLDEDASFLIDGAVSEFTALLKGASTSTALLSPKGQRLTAERPGQGTRWFRDAGFDLITVRAPAAGRWQAQLGDGDSGRISIVSNLELAVGAVPATIAPGYQASVTAALKDDGAVLTDESLLSVVSVEASLQRGDNEPMPLLVSPPMAADGLYQIQLGPVQQAGEYVLQVRAVAPTFTRAKLAVLTLRDPVGLRVETVSATAADVVVDIADANIDFTSLSVIARVSTPTGPAQLVPLGAAQAGSWRLPLSVDNEEIAYEVAVTIKGSYLNNQDFSLTTEPVVVALPQAQPQQLALGLNGDVLRDDTPSEEAPADADDDLEPRAEVPDAVASRPDAAETQQLEPEPTPWWLIAGSTAGTFVVIGLVLGVRLWLSRRKAAAKAVDDESAGDNDAGAPETAPADVFDAVLSDLDATVAKAQASVAEREKARQAAAKEASHTLPSTGDDELSTEADIETGSNEQADAGSTGEAKVLEAANDPEDAVDAGGRSEPEDASAASAAEPQDGPEEAGDTEPARANG